MVDRVLFLPWMRAELDNVADVTSKTGWSPIPGGYRNVELAFPINSAIAVDKTAWDWTMPGWVVRAWFECKMAQCTETNPEYILMCWNRFTEVIGPRAVVRLPDGRRLRQKGFGLMKSGWFLTLSMNSGAQFLQHAVAWMRMGSPGSLPRMWAMGDDMLVRYKATDAELKEYERALGTTGCLVKHTVRSREFCGFSFPGDGVVLPLYQDKHKFLLDYVRSDVEQETLRSYFLLYALVPRFGWLSSVRKRAEFPVGPMYRAWAKGVLALDVLLRLPGWVNQAE